MKPRPSRIVLAPMRPGDLSMDAQSHKAQMHDAEILDQFTRQAEPFARRHAHSNDELLQQMVDCAAVGPDDRVLDVACGPGVVSCFFAKRVRHVTGLDLVPAMLEKARTFQAEQNLANVTWKLGSCTDLPFAGETFDCVVTRFSFHHFLDPGIALREMKRVAKPGGTILVCDVAPDEETQESFNRWELLRDPSHTRALTGQELEELGRAAGLELPRRSHCSLASDLENLLAGSFPKPGYAEKIRALFDEETQAGTNRLGVAARRTEGRILIAYPMVLLAWRKPKPGN